MTQKTQSEFEAALALKMAKKRAETRFPHPENRSTTEGIQLTVDPQIPVSRLVYAMQAAQLKIRQTETGFVLELA